MVGDDRALALASVPLNSAVDEFSLYLFHNLIIMQRRSFIHQGMAASGSALFASPVFAQTTHYNTAQPFQLSYAIHDGMFKNSAGSDFLDQIQFAYDNGFRAMEDNGMMDRSAEEQKK